MGKLLMTRENVCAYCQLIRIKHCFIIGAFLTNWDQAEENAAFFPEPLHKVFVLHNTQSHSQDLDYSSLLTSLIDVAEFCYRPTK